MKGYKTQARPDYPKPKSSRFRGRKMIFALVAFIIAVTLMCLSIARWVYTQRVVRSYNESTYQLKLSMLYRKRGLIKEADSIEKVAYRYRDMAEKGE